MRVLAMYLPQYHAFPENDAWWGEGYTEWTAVKRAKPLFEDHLQPRVPLDDNYYDLSDPSGKTWAWQAELARKYGVYGFSIYQYWFEGKQLMEKPMEILLSHPEIDINYCVCWANETWTRTWYGLEQEILMEQTYGDEKAWRKHFDYLLPFFKDPRYIKVDNRPLLQIYRTFDISELPAMRKCFDSWAREAGFDGICLLSGRTAGAQEERKDSVDGYYLFEPGYSLKHSLGPFATKLYEASVAMKTLVNKLFHGTVLERVIPIDRIHNAVKNRVLSDNECPGVIARWDNTPRRAHKGLMYSGASPEAFESVLKILREKVEGRKLDFVYVNAWNEWGEGAMLEPDTVEGYAYLEAVKNALQ